MIELEPLSVAGLLRLHGRVLDELRQRNIVRSGNAPCKDYCELLFSRAFGWRLESYSASGHDATDGEGVRYQIKARRTTQRSRSRQLPFIRNLPARPFDVLAGVILDTDFRVLRGALVPFEIVAENAAFTPECLALDFAGLRLELLPVPWTLS